MSENMKIWESLRQVPGQAKKTIRAGRLKGMTDIKPQWRLQMMTEQFGPIGIGWYYKTVRTWTESCASEISAHVEVELFIKHDGEWSAPISGIGGAMLLSMEKTKEYDKPIYEFPGLKPYHSDEAYKMATTDALSVAMKQLGVAADVYMGLSDSKYDKKEEDSPIDVNLHQSNQNEPKLMTGRQKGTLKDQMSEMERIGSESCQRGITAITTFLGNPKASFDEAAHMINKGKITLDQERV